MNKPKGIFGSIVLTTTVFVVFSFVFVFAGGAYAASTIGTNMSTTGTFTVTPAANSATSIRFQNAGGTNYLVGDSTNRRVGIGAAPSTTFEVQGTASASYFFTQNTIQVAGVPGATATVAYSRFGTATTGHATDIDASNDLLLTGALEVNGTAFFDGKASVSGNFQTAGRLIAGNASHSFTGDVRLTSNLVVGGTTASSSGGLYVAEFGRGSGTATISILFGSSSASSKGTCFQMKNEVGNWVYARIVGTTWTVNRLECNK